MTHGEVVLLMSGWAEKETRLVTVGRLWGLGFALPGCRVASASGSLVSLVTGDGGRIEVDISEPEIEYRYSEPRELPEFALKHELTEEQQLASSLMVLFPPRSAGEFTEECAECISFSELA